MKYTLILRNLLTTALLLCIMDYTHAQLVEKADSIQKPKRVKKFEPNQAFMFTPIYTAQVPLGDMSKRFGFNNLFGMQVGYKTKTNWMIALEGSFLYGTVVKDKYILDNIATKDYLHINSDNDLTNVRLQEYGYNIKFSAGKIIPFSKKYPDAGILILTGLGFLQHKIAINVRENSLPQLNKTYRKGYDRMSNGPGISQFIGGVWMARKKFISAYAGVQFDMAFTQNRRAYDFYSMGKLNDKRLDMFIGVRVGWIIPVFVEASEKEYYYY